MNLHELSNSNKSGIAFDKCMSDKKSLLNITLQLASELYFVSPHNAIFGDGRLTPRALNKIMIECAKKAHDLNFVKLVYTCENKGTKENYNFTVDAEEVKKQFKNLRHRLGLDAPTEAEKNRCLCDNCIYSFADCPAGHITSIQDNIIFFSDIYDSHKKDSDRVIFCDYHKVKK